MFYIFMFLMGLAAGSVCIYLYFLTAFKTLKFKRNSLAKKGKKINQSINEQIEKRRQFEESQREWELRKQKFESKVISFEELNNENIKLKKDLQNIDLSLRKSQLDHEILNEKQIGIESQSNSLAQIYLRDNIKWIGKNISPNNYAASKKRLTNTIQKCRDIGFSIPPREEQEYLDNLKAEYEMAVKAAFEREEQNRIKAQIREEQQREREIERELKRLENERIAIKAALEKALAEAIDEHSDEIERLKARLAEAEQKTQRAISQAQLTKSGHVYVISNIGSFGDGVYKIGMTRRLEPEMRVRELSGAAVPFPYDIHMMISCDDAPTLENTLHRAFHKMRLNKANTRKEFFKVDLEDIKQIVEECHGEISYIADPEALEYRQSIEMSDEDSEFIDSVYNSLENQ